MKFSTNLVISNPCHFKLPLSQTFSVGPRRFRDNGTTLYFVFMQIDGKMISIDFFFER